MGMIPGVGKAIKNLDIDDNAFKGIEAIISSMTPAERSNPVLLNGSRRKRIADGSGTTVTEVTRLLKQFDETRRIMKMVAKGGDLSKNGSEEEVISSRQLAVGSRQSAVGSQWSDHSQIAHRKSQISNMNIID